MFDNQEIERFIGRSFGGYRVTRFIASGRTGAVFAGVEEASPDNAVAIKLLDPNLTDETFDERFEQTALGVAGLSHPNIVQVRDFGSDGALHFIVTDLIEGESLRDWLVAAHKMGSSLTAETITSIAQQVGGALFFAHRSGYIHGDIKPENILVTNDGWVHVSDFGLVRAIGEHQTTSNGVPAGTPEYLAPEQARGTTPITPLADLYSLAIVTYEMTVGRVPFQARSAATVIRMQEHASPPLPSSLLPGFPPQLESVLMRGLEKDPANRFESVDAFLRSLLATMVPTTHAAVPEPGEAAVLPEQPATDADPTPPVAETPEPVRPVSSTPRRLASTGVTTPMWAFAATRSRRVVLAGGALAIVIATLLIFSPAVFPSAGPGKHSEKTTATTKGPASPMPSSEPAASPPPAPSPTTPPVQVASDQPAPTLPPAASSAPEAVTPPPPPPSVKPVEHVAVPMSAGTAQPVAPPTPSPSPPPPPPSPAAQAEPEPPPPPPPPPPSTPPAPPPAVAAPPQWQPPPSIPSEREIARQFLEEFFADQPPADPPEAGPNEWPPHQEWRPGPPDDGPADSDSDGPPSREQFERDFVEDFFNEP